MAQFDVHRNPFAGDADSCVLELQHDLFSDIDFVLLAPLKRKHLIKRPISILNPVLKIRDDEYVLLTQQVVSVRRNALKEPLLNIAHDRYAILRAIDMMFTGI